MEAVDLLERVGVKCYKVGSGEVTNLPMLDVIGQTGKPVLLSSGMSTWAELDEAVNTLLRHHRQITVLQCTSEYPCPYEEVGLNVMLEMRTRYDLLVGLSDHTMTPYASFVAVALGATVIEKHFTFSRLMYGSDARHSLVPAEFSDMVAGIRAIETMLGNPVQKDMMAASLTTMKEIFEKSIVTVQDIPNGTILTEEMLGIKKPGTGIPASELKKVIGRCTARDLAKDTLLQPDDLD